MIFIKNPIPGNVKTRLGKHIGYDKAAEVYRVLLDITKKAALAVTCQRVVYYGDYINREDHWTAKDFDKKLQKGADLGERMNNAFKTAFDENYRRVVIIGSDCPEITEEHIHEAFEALEKNEVVIGPAADGGYYLLGMKNHYNLFENKEWSTANVLQDTLRELQEKKISHKILKVLSDLDTIEELKQFPEVYDTST